MESESLSDLFEDSDFGGTNMASPDDIFSILGAIESVTKFGTLQTPDDSDEMKNLVSRKSSSSISAFQVFENELVEFGALQKSKRQKFSTSSSSGVSMDQEGNQDGEQNRVSHINVERNRRKQMNEHLNVLRSLMPCFYVKRGDQASIIGGVVDYITELQQLLQSLEARKQRKSVYNEMLSPRFNVSSPRIALSSTLPLSPRKPPLSPRISLPISPRTPQSSSPYKTKLPYSPSCSSSTNCSSSNIINNHDNKNNNYIVMNELVGNSKSAIADVEVKFTASSNVLLKTISPRIPGQATKIVSALEDLSLEILQVNINHIDGNLFNSFTIKIGVECQLSAEELARQIQQTFSRSIS